MDLDYILKKLKYFVDWHRSMSASERRSDVGRWVHRNISIYTEVILDFADDKKLAA
jgi:hypothetical protein